MLIDTSGFFSILSPLDSFHEHANSIHQSATHRLIHNYILAELVPLAQVRGLPRHLILSTITDILDDGRFQFVWVDETLHRKATQLLNARRDKTYSLCDAVSFILMGERGIREALTTDRHFEQEGFVRLLK